MSLFIAVKLIIFFMLSAYTFIALGQSYVEATRRDLQLSFQPPTYRCVPFFDKVLEWHSTRINTSEVLYDYVAGAAVARICTDEVNTTVLNAIGANFYENVFGNIGCPLSQYYNHIVATCKTADAGMDTCADIVNTAPTPDGVHWRHYIYQNATAARTLEPACLLGFHRLTKIPLCPRRYVVPMKHFNRDVNQLILAGVYVPAIINLVQLVILVMFVRDNFPLSRSCHVAFAQDGIVGPIFMLGALIFCHRKVPMDRFRMNFAGFLLLTAQDVFCGLVVPAVAVIGCRVERFPIPYALLILKAIKILFLAILYLKDCCQSDEIIIEESVQVGIEKVVDHNGDVVEMGTTEGTVEV